ncbi:uncharacterized protein LOC124268259 [Haliotis rubra]|uniref:uncharacterized protein LOC124268259 n=1 Tax=Haliotis rubra TaxID=36100 RepID=UPI001EE57913|nr:uncharacterized protein LOC124268259 [Haliotis rubra]
MKSSYPVETQSCENKKFEDDGFKRVSDASFLSKKRKPNTMDVDDGPSKTLPEDHRKHARYGTVYQRPGPPTPANGHSMTRRSSGRLNQSPKTPVSTRRKSRSNSRTPRGTLRRTPKGVSPRTAHSPRWDSENKAPAKLSDRRESIL